MPNATQNDLRFLCDLPAARIADLTAGASLSQRTGYTLDQLVARIAVDRLTLAAGIHREAIAALRRPSFRNAISRAYYSMYQTFRGIVFLVTRGDDHEKHSSLPSHLPADFPAKPTWENYLKNARLERNKADYEPYPRRDADFETRARTICNQSLQLRTVARVYLRGKGVNV